MYDYIEFIICYGEGCSPEEIKEKCRKMELVYARQLIMYFSVLFNVGSYSYIGNLLGGQNHATVNHALKTIKNYMDTDKAKRNKIKYYERLLKKVLETSAKTENLKKAIKPLEKEISDLEQRCINLTVQLSFLKNNIAKIEVN